MPLSVLYLAPDLMRLQSGIARYGRLVCQALLTTRCRLSVVSLMDSREAKLEALARFSGISYHPCGGARWEFVHQAVRATWRCRPSVILVGHANLAPLGRFLAGLGGIPWILFIYGVEVFYRMSPWKRWALRGADRIISISHYTKSRAVQENGIPAGRVRILPNCLDPVFDAPLLTEKRDEAISMLTVGRMSLAEQYKGHDYVIRAMPGLLEQSPGLVYNIVGEGDWRPRLEALVEEMQVANSVRFHGFASEEELRRHYAQAMLYIMPSRAEGFGFVFLEAMAYGLPVIGGNLDATREVVVHGDTGYLVDPTSLDSIQQAVIRLIQDDSLRQRMGEAARQRVRDNFGYSRFRLQLLELLEEVVPDFGLLGRDASAGLR